MHDLVLDFVLGKASKGDPAWIIKHDDASKWGGDERSKSCTKISLTCTGMPKFPRDFKYPNLSLLQLMHGDLSLKFPKDFYENMENLKVVAYYEMHYPLLPRSLQCYTNLKSLYLHRCSLNFDCSFVGDLVNLEVLSFAYCGIRKLPSMLGNMRKLKLLDLTGCHDLHIDDCVLKNLENLEELYMRGSYEKLAIRFTDTTFEELKMLSSQLRALEIEFVEKKAQLENMSFKNLDKFKISMGCLLNTEYKEEWSSRNALKLVTDSSSDLVDCKINKLFKKTEKLHLQVKDMIGLEEIISIHPSDQPSFYKLRELDVANCVNLKFLFPIHVASSLEKLELLKISSCSVLEALIGNDGSEIDAKREMISFRKLKFLSLKKLPKLVSLFLVNNVVELPELAELEVDGLPNFTSIYCNKNVTSVLFNSQVKVSKLEKLKINRMEKLKQIWACSSLEEEADNITNSREICVERCDSVVNVFPTNPMRLLNNLERFTLRECGSIEVIFNIDLECVGHEVEQLRNKLRSIYVSDLEKLREVWRIKGGENDSSSVRGFGGVESIEINDCKRFRNVFTPTNTQFDLRSLENIRIQDCGERGSNKEVTEYLPGKERDNNNSSVAFPSNLMHAFDNLHTFNMGCCNGVEVVFKMESPTTSRRELVTTTDNQQPPLLPNLQELHFWSMRRMTHVWKWNNFLLLQKQSSFHNLTTINMVNCKRIKYLFSPLMAKLLSNLKTINISECGGMEEVVSNRDDKDEEMTTSSTTFFPHLHSLSFTWLKNLKCIGGGGHDKGTTNVIDDQYKFSQIGVVPWSLCQYSREICISGCALSSAIPSYAVGQMQKLQVLEVYQCESLIEAFETQGINDHNKSCDESSNLDEGNGGTDTIAKTLAIPKLENISVPRLSSLKNLIIENCNLLQHVFPFSALESLRKLEDLRIEECSTMKMIVKEDNGDQKMTSKVVEFPRLKSLVLLGLPNLKGFFLGISEFRWPLLETVKIRNCPQMTVFTSGESTTPKLKYIHTSFGKHSLERGLNFYVTTMHQALQNRLPFSPHNLIEIDMGSTSELKNIIPFTELLQLQKLERIRLYFCEYVEEVFDVEAIEGTNSELQTVVQIPNLTQLKLLVLYNLKYIWKNNHHQRTVLEFPNLTTLSLDYCTRLKHVFTSSMVGSVLQLQDLHISNCKNMVVIVEVEEEEEEEEELEPEPIVKEEELELKRTTNSGSVESQIVVKFSNLRQVKLDWLESLKYIWKSSHHQRTVLLFPNLTTLSIDYCKGLKHVFTNSMVGSVLQLQDLYISNCENMEAIVKVEESGFECEAKVKEIVLPSLKSLKLKTLKNLKGFCLEKDDFSLPLLDTLKIKECHEITVFTMGHVATPMLYIVDTSFGRYYIREDINSFIKNNRHEGFSFCFGRRSFQIYSG